MKVAIGFFGITRSLKYTVESIKQNIFHVLKSNNIDYDVYIHSYRLTTYKNKRTGECIEDPSEIDNEEYKLLNPQYFTQDNQDEIAIKLNLLSYRTHEDPWNTQYNSVDNYILGSYSKHIVTQMIDNNIQEYDYILFVRPDCLYLDKLNVGYFDLINDTTIVIPDNEGFGVYNLNDRFAITNSKNFKIYGDIFLSLLNISKKKPLHSETILGDILIGQNKLNIRKVKFNFSRIRCNGTIQDKHITKHYEPYKHFSCLEMK